MPGGPASAQQGATMSAPFHGAQSCAARALRLLDTASGHWPAPPQRQWGVSVRKGRRGRAEENPPSPTAARRPLAGCQPSSPAVGRRAPQTLRSLPPRARLLSRPRPGGAGGRPPSARALQPVSRRPAPPPRPRSRAGPPPLLPPRRVSAAAAAATAAEIGIRLLALGKGGGRRAGKKARAASRPSARDENRTAARGATGLGPLHAQGGGRAGPPPCPGGSPRPPRSAPRAAG